MKQDTQESEAPTQYYCALKKTTQRLTILNNMTFQKTTVATQSRLHGFPHKSL